MAEEWLFGVEITPKVGKAMRYHYYRSDKEIVSNGIKRSASHIIDYRPLWKTLRDFKQTPSTTCEKGRYRLIKEIDKKKEEIKGCLEDGQFTQLLQYMSEELNS